MNEIQIFFIHSRINWIWIIFNSNTFHWLFLFLPNVDFVFLYWLPRWIFLHNISLNLYIYLCVIMETIISSLPTFHWTNDSNMSKIKIHFLYCDNAMFFLKEIHNFLVKNNLLFTITLFLSCISSHNPHVLLYLNGGYHDWTKLIRYKFIMHQLDYCKYSRFISLNIRIKYFQIIHI